MPEGRLRGRTEPNLGMQEEGETGTAVKDRRRDAAGDVREKYGGDQTLNNTYRYYYILDVLFVFFNEKGLADWNSYF